MCPLYFGILKPKPCAWFRVVHVQYILFQSNVKLTLRTVSKLCESEKVLVAQTCLTLCDPMDCSLSAYQDRKHVHGIFQARTLEWVAIPFSRSSCWPRGWPWISCMVGRFFTIWATREAQWRYNLGLIFRLNTMSTSIVIIKEDCYLVANSYPTLCDSMDCSMPGFSVLHCFPEFAQTHVHWISDTIQPSHPLSSPSPPAFNLSQHQGLFQWVNSLHQVAEVLELQLQHQPFQWIFRADFL